MCYLQWSKELVKGSSNVRKKYYTISNSNRYACAAAATRIHKEKTYILEVQKATKSLIFVIEDLLIKRLSCSNISTKYCAYTHTNDSIEFSPFNDVLQVPLNILTSFPVHSPTFSDLSLSSCVSPSHKLEKGQSTGWQTERHFLLENR